MDLALLVKHESKSRVDKILWKAQSHYATNYNTSDVVTALTSQTQPENANTVTIIVSYFRKGRARLIDFYQFIDVYAT